MTIKSKIPAHIRSLSLVEYASMCEDAYDVDDRPINHILKECGWERVPGGSWPTGDFFARLYVHKESRQTILAYRGTKTLENWWHNSRLTIFKWLPECSYIGFAKDTYHKALKLVETKNFSPPMALTGHSLGGCLAQITAVDINNRAGSTIQEPSLYAITFNPLQADQTFLGGGEYELLYHYILNYNIENDRVHKFINAPRGAQQHTLSGNMHCSTSERNKRAAARFKKAAVGSMFGIAGGTTMLTVGAEAMKDFAGCTLDEHEIKLILESLWAKFEDPHGEACIPVRPKNIVKHEHDPLSKAIPKVKELI